MKVLFRWKFFRCWFFISWSLARVVSLADRNFTFHVWLFQDRQLKVKELVLSAHDRAVRNCPWTVGLWIRYLLAMERHRVEHSIISGKERTRKYSSELLSALQMWQMGAAGSVLTLLLPRAAGAARAKLLWLGSFTLSKPWTTWNEHSWIQLPFNSLPKPMYCVGLFSLFLETSGFCVDISLCYHCNLLILTVYGK